MLTAVSTVLGMIPIATVFWGPMAFAIMGGLLVGTLLTLIFLPALYVAWFGPDTGPEQAAPTCHPGTRLTDSPGGGAPPGPKARAPLRRDTTRERTGLASPIRPNGRGNRLETRDMDRSPSSWISPCKVVAPTAPSPGACSTACWKKAGCRSTAFPAPPPAP